MKGNQKTCSIYVLLVIIFNSNQLLAQSKAIQTGVSVGAYRYNYPIPEMMRNRYHLHFSIASTTVIPLTKYLDFVANAGVMQYMYGWKHENVRYYDPLSPENVYSGPARGHFNKTDVFINPQLLIKLPHKRIEPYLAIGPSYQVTALQNYSSQLGDRKYSLSQSIFNNYNDGFFLTGSVGANYKLGTTTLFGEFNLRRQLPEKQNFFFRTSYGVNVGMRKTF